MFGDNFPDEWAIDPRSGHLLRAFNAGGRTFQIAVATPTQAGGEPLPLLMLTDAASHFTAAAAIAAALARRPEKTGVGPMIVAGIGCFGPGPASREQYLVPGEPGADALQRLILETILPGIGAHAAIDARRSAFMGHSLGALFALDMAARAPALFPACIALSPSFWRLPELAGRAAAAMAGHGVRILLASGGREPERMTGPLPAAAEALARHATVDRRVLADEDHGSLPFAAMPAALRFIHAG